jgi:hypothetical protein
MRNRPKPLETAGLRTVKLSERPSQVSIRQFCTPCSPEARLSEFLDALPDVLAARDLRELGKLIASAGRGGKEILVMCGGHVVKTGLTPLIIRLMRQGLVTAVAVNGAVAVHDAEIAMIGATSEDVASSLDEGMFGVARETAEVLNRAAEWAWKEQRGLGEGLGHVLHEMRVPHGEQSLLLQAHDMGRPVSVGGGDRAR